MTNAPVFRHVLISAGRGCNTPERTHATGLITLYAFGFSWASSVGTPSVTEDSAVKGWDIRAKVTVEPDRIPAVSWHPDPEAFV